MGTASTVMDCALTSVSWINPRAPDTHGFRRIQVLFPHVSPFAAQRDSGAGSGRLKRKDASFRGGV